MARKYDEVIEDTQKVLDQILMFDMPKKVSPPKVSKPVSLGLGESSKVVDESAQVSMQPDLFISGVLVSLDTLQDINDPFMDNVDNAMEFEDQEQIEEGKLEEKQEEKEQEKELQQEEKKERQSKLEKFDEIRLDTLLLLTSMDKPVSPNVDSMDKDELMRLSFMDFTKSNERSV